VEEAVEAIIITTITTTEEVVISVVLTTVRTSIQMQLVVTNRNPVECERQNFIQVLTLIFFLNKEALKNAKWERDFNNSIDITILDNPKLQSLSKIC
jgi:hypothetical protein